MGKTQKHQPPENKHTINKPTNKEIWYSTEFTLPYDIKNEDIDTLLIIMQNYFNDGVLIHKNRNTIKISYLLQDSCGFINIFTRFLPPKELIKQQGNNNDN